MKKKFLIALFVVVMVCLFAFSVSAADEVTLTDGKKADFTTVFKVNSNNQVTGFNDGYTKDGITDVIFPDDIEGIECNSLFQEATNLKTLTFAASDTFFISGDNIFTKCSVKTITFNPDCVVEIRKGNFSGCTSLTQITFPKFKKLAGSSFYGCSNMVATNELVLAEGMTDIGGHAFHDCTSLTGTVYFPSTLETIQEYSFQNTGFGYFDLSKCANLTAVGGGYGGPFTDNDSITTLDLSACVNLKDLKSNFAANCDNLTKVILPPNLENIPSKAFAHCYKLQSIALPASLKTIEDEAFHSARKDQEIKTFTVYIQSNVVFGTTYYPFRDSSAKIEFVLVGKDVSAESFKAANTYSAITNATVVDYLDSASYTVGGAITNNTIVENYSPCKAFYDGEHDVSNDDGLCSTETLCARSGCNEVAIEAKEHNLIITISYPNGFAAAGTKECYCPNENCTKEDSKIELSAIFTSEGYSIREDGKALLGGYKINSDALKAYYAYLDEKGKDALKFGVVMSNEANL
ncbi:MAG: leucine-rich repeat domain-containing protein, partial [Clostridia bacterium]|nr:leucine-rich repeat domain-containing protein [Clostridia bacterium]